MNRTTGEHHDNSHTHADQSQHGAKRRHDKKQIYIRTKGQIMLNRSKPALARQNCHKHNPRRRSGTKKTKPAYAACAQKRMQAWRQKSSMTNSKKIIEELVTLQVLKVNV